MLLCVWKVIQSSESNRKGKVSRWRAEAKRKKDRERKRKEKRRKTRPLGGAARKKDTKGAAICGMMKVTQPKHQSQRKDAVRDYTTQHVPGAHLNFSQRQTLASDWNAIIRAGCRITLRSFVRRWYPKGTDFGRCTRADMHRLERVINSIHRRLLGGKTACEYDTAYVRAA